MYVNFLHMSSLLCFHIGVCDTEVGVSVCDAEVSVRDAEVCVIRKSVYV